MKSEQLPFKPMRRTGARLPVAKFSGERKPAKKMHVVAFRHQALVVDLIPELIESMAVTCRKPPRLFRFYRPRDFLRLKWTQQEKRVAHAVACGLSNRQVADKLGIQEQTVKDHINSLMRKAGLRPFEGSRVKFCFWYLAYLVSATYFHCYFLKYGRKKK